MNDDVFSKEFQFPFGKIRGDKLQGFLLKLTHREREIIKLRFGYPDGYVYTLEEIGRIFRVTRERARQIEGKALRKLEVIDSMAWANEQ